VERLEDTKGDKDEGVEEHMTAQRVLPALGKRLKMRLCAAFPDVKPSLYQHLFADHIGDYLDELERLSGVVGFRLTLKMLSQDAVEAGHKSVFSSSSSPERKELDNCHFFLLGLIPE